VHAKRKVQYSHLPAELTSKPQLVCRLKITLLSTMLVGEVSGLGEWGFSALIEADDHRILMDAGAHPQTVLNNARALNIDLLGVREVILTHNHDDHIGGLLTLRRKLMKRDPAALSVVHAGRGIFYRRPSPDGEDNAMIALRQVYEATGGKFVEHSEWAELFPGGWLTGPVPRKYSEQNWSDLEKVWTPHGLVDDDVPEDVSLLINTKQGLVAVVGCGHAGVVNILTHALAKFGDRPIYGLVGGLHLFSASIEHLGWTADKLKEFMVANLLGAHCTGIEAVYHLRQRIGLTPKSAVVGSVGSAFVLGKGITCGEFA